MKDQSADLVPYSSLLFLPNPYVSGESYGQGEGSCQRSKGGEEMESEVGLWNQVQQNNWDTQRPNNLSPEHPAVVSHTHTHSNAFYCTVSPSNLDHDCIVWCI